MNQLNKIILINSAKVDFHEIQLDGNIHFIGTQGTGKSTLLRAILFFYNADARKLGISKEKSSFSDYYFPYADSYIIYEVRQKDRNFCVWLYKKKNRLCFRFIDGPYGRDIFIEDRRPLAETEIIEKANLLGYRVHRPIYSFTEYRDIIYGANKSMSRFHLLQNPSYHNIPRTISNIFLNSSLDGGFIKTTIINSLSDDPFELNLDTNRHHIETARNDYRDVSQFVAHEKMAQNIVSSYNNLLQMEEGQKQLAWEIGAAYNKARQEEQGNEDNHKIIETKLNDQNEKIKKSKTEHSISQNRIHSKLSVVKSDIKKANQLVKSYAEQNIDQIIAENEKKAAYEAKQSQLQNQLQLITANLKDVENQYKNEKQRLGNECQLQIINFKNSKAKEKEHIINEIARLKNDFYLHKDQLTEEFNTKLDELNLAKTQIEHQINELDFKIRSISQQHFLKKEQDELIHKIQEAEKRKHALVSQQELIDLNRESKQKEGKKELELIELKSSQITEKFVQQKETLLQELERVKSELQALSGSLIEFLETHQPAWNQTIGKIASKDILLRNDLNPTLSVGDNCYGLNLDLKNLNPVQLSKSDLESQVETITKKLQKLNIKIDNHSLEVQDQKDKLQKKYNKQLSDLKQQKMATVAELEKTEINLEKFRLSLNEVAKNAEKIKQEQQELAQAEKHKLEREKQAMMTLITKLNEQHHQTIKSLKTTHQTNEKKLKAQQKALENEVSSGAELIDNDFKIKIKELESQRNKLLEDKGVDTKEIKELEEKLETVNAKLKEIETNFPLVIRYKKDCEDYIDKLADFQQTRKELENALEHAENLFQNRLGKEQSVLNDLLKQKNQIEALRKDLKRELEAFDQFRKSRSFEELHNYTEHHDVGDSWHCDGTIRQLQDLSLRYEKQDKTLTEKITVFAGCFNPNNCLGFETNLAGNQQYRAFAENLKEFVHEQKIVDYKTEVTRKYAMVLANIVNETNELLKREEDVLKVIQRINGDFRKSNFVGVVKSIEMRIQESSNKIIQLLRKIRTFQAENNLSYGEINLFNQDTTGSNNEEAVNLLESLLQQIGQAKSKTIKLEDAFDLEFRIKENENDTNWVSRLANVGSNGTDVLVKSMIYINLLHIFKSNGSKPQSETILHCLIDEVGILHDSNVTGLISFAGERNIRLINGSPNSHNESDYKHIYMFRKNPKSNKTGITKLISHEL